MSNGYNAWERSAAAHRADCWQQRQRQLELENDLPAAEPQAVEQTTRPMTEEECQAWSTWAHSIVTNRLHAFVDERMLPLIEAVADELGALGGKAAREQDAKIKQLESEIAALRADLQISQSIVRNNIAMLSSMRRKNAA
jgi:hypothetical protein